jgi:hypothetical protein
MEGTTGTQNPQSDQQPESSHPRHRDRNGLIGGLVLVTLGVLFLADNFIPDVRFRDFWPLILVAIGVGLLWRHRQNG